MSEYQYPAEPVFYQEEIKSTFIVHIAHTPDLAAAKPLLKKFKINTVMHDIIVGRMLQATQVVVTFMVFRMMESQMVLPVSPCLMC